MTNHRPEPLDPDPLLRDDNGDPIGTRAYCIDEGLPAAAGDGLVAALGTLSPEDIAQVLLHRRYIEQAKGILMFIYDIDDERAFELLAMRSRSANVTLPALAERLINELRNLPRDGRTNVQSACDALLLEAGDRVVPTLEGF